MAPKYKLTYFPLSALGEPIRFLLSYGQLEFEDYRFDRSEWPKIKPTTPFGKAPVLEIDGKTVHQSSAICRYLAKQLNLCGKNDWEALQIDIVVDTIGDLRTQLSKYFYDADDAAKGPKLEVLQKETVPFFLSRFEKMVEENGGYFVGGQVTWADLYFIAISDYLMKMAEMDFFKDYPNLKCLKEKITNIPQISNWLKKRPSDVWA